MPAADLRMIEPAGKKLPARWRLAVSARPGVWHPAASGRSRGYRLLRAKNEARIWYVLATEARARELLATMAEELSDRASGRDEFELPLFYRSPQE